MDAHSDGAESSVDVEVQGLSIYTRHGVTEAEQEVGQRLVIDVEFDTGELPEIYNALEIRSEGENGGPAVNLVAEVQQHIGRNQVRAVAM